MLSCLQENDSAGDSRHRDGTPTLHHYRRRDTEGDEDSKPLVESEDVEPVPLQEITNVRLDNNYTVCMLLYAVYYSNIVGVCLCIKTMHSDTFLIS